MESLFLLILIRKVEVFVICIAEIKLSIVLFVIMCDIIKDVKFSLVWKRWEAFNKKFWFKFLFVLFLYSTFSYACIFSRELSFNASMSIFCKDFSVVSPEFFFTNFIFMHFLSFLISVVQVIDKTFEFSQKDSVQKGIIICKYLTLS